VPALPARHGQLEQPHDANQPVGRIRHRDLAGNPVPDGPGCDMKKLPGCLVGQPGIGQQDLEA
jgi:hypothetical protein